MNMRSYDMQAWDVAFEQQQTVSIVLVIKSRKNETWCRVCSSL